MPDALEELSVAALGRVSPRSARTQSKAIGQARVASDMSTPPHRKCSPIRSTWTPSQPRQPRTRARGPWTLRSSGVLEEETRARSPTRAAPRRRASDRAISSAGQAPTLLRSSIPTSHKTICPFHIAEKNTHHLQTLFNRGVHGGDARECLSVAGGLRP